MNQHRCETCKNCNKNPNDDYFCLVMNDEIDFTNFEHTAKVGCASHSDFQSERDKEAHEHGWFTDWEMEQAELKGYNKGNADGIEYGRKSERNKVLEKVRLYAHERMLTKVHERAKAFCEIVDFVDEKLQQKAGES